jgi:hypothetical protein
VARIRTIKPEFPQSETMGRVSRDARLLFIQLWTIADDSGRARGNSRVLASLLYPYDDDARGLIDGWLGELERAGAVRRYVVEGETFLEIPNWLKHQKIDRPSASKFPAFDEGSRILASPRELSPPDLDREGKGREGSVTHAREPEPAPPERPPETPDPVPMAVGGGANVVALRLAPAPARAREPATDPDNRAAWLAIRTVYPRTPVANWLAAEKHARSLVATGEATWPELQDSVGRMARHCRATSRQVFNPARFFTGDPEAPWRQAWTSETVRPTEDPEAARAWAAYVASGYTAPDERIQAAADAAGGYHAIRERRAADEPRLKAAFCRAYVDFRP